MSLVILRAFTVGLVLWIGVGGKNSGIKAEPFWGLTMKAPSFFETALGWFLCLNCCFIKPQAPALPPAVATVTATAKSLSSVEASLSWASISCVYPAEVARSDGPYCLMLDLNNQMIWKMKPRSSREAVLGRTLACHLPALLGTSLRLHLCLCEVRLVIGYISGWGSETLCGCCLACCPAHGRYTVNGSEWSSSSLSRYWGENTVLV